MEYNTDHSCQSNVVHKNAQTFTSMPLHGMVLKHEGNFKYLNVCETST